MPYRLYNTIIVRYHGDKHEAMKYVDRLCKYFLYKAECYANHPTLARRWHDVYLAYCDVFDQLDRWSTLEEVYVESPN
jgi:hypothetical protein